jgi:hypothetical protein
VIQPQAWLKVGGVKLTGQPSATAPQVLSGLEVTWGRAELFGQPDPATAVVEVFDPSGTWATGLDSLDQADLMGDAVDIGATIDGADWTSFRGRIDRVAVAPATFDGIAGARVSLSLVSRLALYGSQSTGSAWPEETHGARLARLVTRLSAFGSGGVTGVDPPSADATKDARLVAAAPADENLLENLGRLADAWPATYSYHPHDSEVRMIARRSYARTGIAGLDTADGITGAVIASHGGLHVVPFGSSYGSPRMFLDGAGTGAADESGWVARTAEQRITSVSVAYKNKAAAYADATVLTSSSRAISTSTAQRATLETVLVETAAVTALADELLAQVTDEGAAWRPAPVVLDTTFTGGFTDALTARHLLAGGETPAVVFLQRTLLPRLGIRPVFAVIGGTIGHLAGAWRLTLTLAPVFTSERQHAVTWAEIDDGTEANTLRWHGDGADHADTFHESVTFPDLGYCSTGLGVLTPGPDTGWDTYQ